MSYAVQPASLPEHPPADFLSARRLIPEADSQDVRNQRNHKQMGKYDFIPQESQVTGQYGEEQYNDSARAQATCATPQCLARFFFGAFSAIMVHDAVMSAPTDKPIMM